jgi:hypothetical protein
MRKLWILVIFTILLLATTLHSVLAQENSAGFATYVPIGGEPSEGSVICSDDSGSNNLCSREYDPNMIGVVVSNPAVSFVTDNLDGSSALLSSGKGYVLVSTINGEIEIGSFITSSKIKGIGQKATKSGYILGVAQEDYKESNPDKYGKVMVNFGIKPAVLKQGAGINLFRLIRDGVEGAFESPLAALRYLVSAIIVTVIFIYGFIHFGRIAKSGVEAIGRNPLASKSIQGGVAMNMAVTILIMAGSIFVAYLILII